MNPLTEDQVTFRIATNIRGRRAGEAAGGLAAQHAGRRAVEARSAAPAVCFHAYASKRLHGIMTSVAFGCSC